MARISCPRSLSASLQPTEIEQGTEAEGWSEALKLRGHEMRAIAMTSGIQAILEIGRAHV